MKELMEMIEMIEMTELIHMNVMIGDQGET